jgi:rhodanese-related sulfurtransferase
LNPLKAAMPNPVESLNPLVTPTMLEAALRADPAIRLLDVRTPAEFETAHIAGAYNVPLDTLQEHSTEIRFGIQAPIVLICHSGGRARKAEEALRIAGMEQLHVLDGGVSAWMQQGRPLVQGRVRMSLERQVRVAAGALVVLGSLVALLLWPGAVLLPLLVGSGLVFAGLTDSCMMGMLLARLPYNKPAGCDIPAAIRALTGSSV